MMISYIFTPCPLCGIVIILIFIIGGIINGFRKLGRKMDAYNEKYEKQEDEMCYKEKEDDEIIEISNPWSENRMHFAIVSYDKRTKMYQAYVYHGRESTIVTIVTKSKVVIERKIDETYKRFDSKKNE